MMGGWVYGFWIKLKRAHCPASTLEKGFYRAQGRKLYKLSRMQHIQNSVESCQIRRQKILQAAVTLHFSFSFSSYFS